MPILPGEAIGVMGGGQLGRMFALAAKRMGYRVHVFSQSADSPAAQVSDAVTVAEFADVDAALEFARGVKVVTFEFENIPAETLEPLTDICPVRPSPNVLHICRHRVREKTFLSENGFPVTNFVPVNTLEELRLATQMVGFPAILKTAAFGYDGKGQVRLQDSEAIETAWRDTQGVPGILEAFVPFEKEISVICANNGHQVLCFPVCENKHRNHILDVTVAPADILAKTADEASELAIAITEKLDVIGILAVEMFLLGDGKVVVNELAPRPHNSGHSTVDASVTSQFEQQLRAVCRLPLGSPTQIAPTAMANLLGDLWEKDEPNWSALLKCPEIKLHLYGKKEPHRGRKMGHVTACSSTMEDAERIVLEARSRLTSG